MMKIPEHVMRPGNQAHFVAEENCRPLKSAGLGYSIFEFQAYGEIKDHSWSKWNKQDAWV